MLVSNSWLRVGAAAFLMAGLLGLGLGCKGKSTGGTSPTNRTVSGAVTYVRKPLLVGADGVPTGFEVGDTQDVTVAARGVQVRVFQSRAEVATDGTTSNAWLLAGSGVTDVAGIQDAYLTFVELGSVAAGSSTSVRLVGDPDGIGSQLPEPSRPLYFMRKGVDGSTSTVSSVPGTLIGADCVVNFAVGLTDPWLLAPGNWNSPDTGPFPYPPTVAAGSRVLAILDSIYYFTNVYGDPTPGSLDLHYYPGRTDPRGSFVEYDTTRYPKAFNGIGLVHFGSLAGGGGSDPDDAFNAGVLFPILARNNLYGQNKSLLLPTASRGTNLTPPVSVVDGLADVMAANLMQSPFLADPSLPTRFPARDIRDLSKIAPVSRPECSVPTIAALGWELTLKANLIASPGLPTDWAKISPVNLQRLFVLIAPTTSVSNGNGITTAPVTDVSSLFAQLGRLQEGQASSDALNLQTYFPDTYLAPLLTQFNLVWPTISALPNYTKDWGLDPDSLVKALDPFTLSMAGAARVQGVFPNCSFDEVRYFMLQLTLDRAYLLSVSTVPALPAGATLEVSVDAGANGTYIYGGDKPSSNRVALRGNYGDISLPVYHYVQVRIISKDAVQPDLQVTLNLNKTN